MKPDEHVNLLRELAAQVLSDEKCSRPIGKRRYLATRARQAADEIKEGIEGASVSGEQFSLTLTLEMIALIAHGGGLIEFSDPHKALAEIRNLSLPWLGDQIDNLQRKEAARFGGGEVG